MNHILNMLAGDTFVDFYLLEEDTNLVSLIKAGTYYEDLVAYVNENY